MTPNSDELQRIRAFQLRRLGDQKLKNMAQELYSSIQFHFSSVDLKGYDSVTTELVRRGYEIKIEKCLAFKKRDV